ncbi:MULTISPECIES: flagellar hook-associated protein FlgK [unclassified Thioalkalivibrio]|uniref:flagellar hook-associated protein FlgK n=1 Tax=unclassified Thioalkalivibrio TaxID=2621013 RepID=UPI0003656B84|nr:MULTISPECIES: flagellar hook-associated protein FlgK [unclassified Thioalkalivibrio]
MSVSGIGTSALLAFQRAIGTTSNNIANSATEGYSRQRTELGNLNPQFLGGSYQGQGVGVDAIRRISDDFVNTQLRTSISEQSNAQAKADLAGRIDNLLADEASGLAPVLQGFFDAASDVANDPTSNAARTVFLTEAESLAERFKAIDGRLEEQRRILNGQIETNVKEINQLAESLAGLNREIVAKSTQGTPNDLLDQRDRVLNQLAEKIDVTTVEQDDGALNVFIGNGQALVLGGTNQSLVAESFSGDPGKLEVGIQSGSGVANVTRFLQGGELGGLLEIRDSVIDPAQNTLGQIATQLGQAFNEQNAQGLDADGQIGGDIFGIGEPAVWGRSSNAESGVPGVEIADPDRLTTSDYRLRVNSDEEFELLRLPGNQVVEMEDLGDGRFRADGMIIDVNELDNPDDPTEGDNWLIQPTRNGARDLEVVLDDPAGIAAAAALPEATVADGDDWSGTVDALEVADGFDPSLLDSAATIVIDSDTDEYVVEDADGNEIGRGAVNGGDAVTIETEHGWSITLSGEPGQDDQLTIGLDRDRPGDNRNMLEMADLSEARTVQTEDGERRVPGFGDSYNSLIANVGTRTRQANVALDSANAQLEQAKAQRESISGVNLDEEAADLIRYQQAYQAAAQVIQVSNSLFDSLLGAFRR